MAHPFPNKVSQVACGAYFSAVITSEGTLYMCGENIYGETGQGHKNRVPSFSLVPLPAPVISIGCGYGHTVALTSEGLVYSWGRNVYGELGLSEVLGTGLAESLTPTLVPGLQDISAISVSYGNFARTRQGAWWAWGWNGCGSLGTGDFQSLSLPTRLTWTTTSIIGIACGGAHTLALLEDSSVLVWGHNLSGQLGIGKTPEQKHPSPLLLPFPHKVVSIGALNDHSYLITSEGTVYTWGYASGGRLGRFGVRSRPQVVLEGGEFGRAKLPKEAEEWITVFRWLFLGIIGEGSAFCFFPVEVVYNFVSITFS
jgi:alpha-tubulin suppressor-like RCC1 family protein